MARAVLRRLRVSGVGLDDAEVKFGPKLTLITGRSETGKTHIVECLDFALGDGGQPKEIPERDGYDVVALELEHDGSAYVISRRMSTPDDARIFVGPLDEWDGQAGQSYPVSISGAPKSSETLSGWLLEVSGFDVNAPIIKSQKGKHQRLSFRTFAPMAIVDEESIITSDSPILSAQRTEHTANRSIFGIVLTGLTPTLEEVEEMRQAHQRREEAGQRLGILDPMIAEVHRAIEDNGAPRSQIEADLKRLEEELAEVSETVTKSGERARAMMGERNRSLHAADKANREAGANRDLQDRFRLLRQHYEVDVRRLEFVMEGGHFFQQIAASHCPTCGREIEIGGDLDCHPESAEFLDIEKAARAEIAKLSPRLKDLDVALEEAAEREVAEEQVADQARERAEELDREIEEVANPSAAAARGRVADVTARRRTLEEQLLRFRELDRYQAARQQADAVFGESVEGYRPGQDAESLTALASQVEQLLLAWHFPVISDVRWERKDDDLVIDGKRRRSFGKGVRAITHTAFTVGLMLHCLKHDTPHPGFAVLDSPLTPYKGEEDEIDDPELTAEVRPGLLHSLATLEIDVQTIIVENIDPPDSLPAEAVVHEFGSSDGSGRAGFYPPRSAGS
ncbi:MAG: AAA family ATPase [Thermomicrobiales bacterium]